MSSLKRILWISDYFPRPHNLTTGVWALETALAIQKRGIEVVALSPTPWIPRWLAFTSTFKEWSSIPCEFKIKNLPVIYARCPHYPHRLVTKYFYNHIPFLDSSLIWHWCGNAISKLIARYSFQLIHCDFVFPGGFIGLEVKKKYKIPLFVHERSPQRLIAALNNRFRRRIYAQVIREADAAITKNYMMADLIKQLIPREIAVIRSAANLEQVDINARQKPEKYKGKKIVLSVGALAERKGHEYLIHAINGLKDEFPDIGCIIIGSGIHLRRLEELIKRLSLTNMVELYGQRPHEEVLGVMSWCDVFVLPSWGESFGTVYAEAMSFGKPIIACAGEGISEVVQDGVQGLLVKKQDVESLAKALKRLLENKDLALKLGREGRVLVEKELNYDFVASRIIDLYKRIIQGQSV